MDTNRSLEGPKSQDDYTRRIYLEEKIKIMWKTIEDLKKKVLEERELLNKEKSENSKINENADRLRKKLSVFHLPNCPKHNTPPCQIHSLGSKEGFPLASPQPSVDIQSYEELLKILDMDDQTQDIDVFEEPLVNAEAEANKLMVNFILSLSQHWQAKHDLEHTLVKSGQEENSTIAETQHLERRS